MARLVIGIAGPYCSGKTTLAAMLAARFGWEHLEVDHLGHQALAESLPALREAFGPGIFAPDGSVDRKALGRIVFADAKARRVLEGIVHPRMLAMVTQRARASLDQPLLINAALLYPMGLDQLCQQVILVRAPYLLRQARARRRDGLSATAFRERVQAQTTLLPKAAALHADNLTVMNRRTVRSLGFLIRQLEQRNGRKAYSFDCGHRRRLRRWHRGPCPLAIPAGRRCTGSCPAGRRCPAGHPRSRQPLSGN